MSLDTYDLWRREDLSKYDIAEIFGCEKAIGPQLAAYKARILLQRLEGTPNPEGEDFLASDHYRRAREVADREAMFLR